MMERTGRVVTTLAPDLLSGDLPVLDDEAVEDVDKAPDNEVEEEILDLATAARTMVELKAEIETLKGQ